MKFLCLYSVLFFDSIIKAKSVDGFRIIHVFYPNFKTFILSIKHNCHFKDKNDEILLDFVQFHDQLKLKFNIWVTFRDECHRILPNFYNIWHIFDII